MVDQIRPRIVPQAEITTAPLRVQRGAIVAALRRRHGSRSDLTRRLGLSASVISRLVHGLLADGWLVEAGIESVALGRPKTILTLNPDVGHVITAILGAGTMHVRIVDAGGHALLTAERELFIPASVDDILEQLDELVAEAGLDNRTIAAGFSAPGVVGPDGDVLHAPDLGWTAPVRLASRAAEHFGCSVTVDNDVNLMMLAEAVSGVATDVAQAVFVYHGVRGIGLGIMSDGAILTGAHGAAGEIGLMPLDLADASSKARELEASYSLTAIAKRLSELGVEDVTAPLDALALAASEGRDGGLMDELTRVVGRAVAVVTLLLDPEMVVIGGALRSVLGSRLEDLRRALEGWVPAMPRIELSQLGELELQLAVQTKCWDSLLTQEL